MNLQSLLEDHAKLKEMREKREADKRDKDEKRWGRGGGGVTEVSDQIGTDGKTSCSRQDAARVKPPPIHP